MGLALTCGLSSQASAQTAWPTRPVQVNLGFAPGSGADILGRYFARKLEEKAGQGFVIVNRAGATGTLALRAVAPADATARVMLLADHDPSHGVPVRRPPHCHHSASVTSPAWRHHAKRVHRDHPSSSNPRSAVTASNSPGHVPAGLAA
jgi:hypothetical protein